MYGESASKLIRHITREFTDIIPEYQYELVEQVMRENDELYADNLRTSQTVTDRNTNEDDTAPTTNGDAEDIVGPYRSGNSEEDDSHQDDWPDREPGVPDNIDMVEKEIMVMQARHTAKLWNKRCIIAYHYERLNRLKKLRWEYGNNLPQEIAKNLSENELEWFTKYNDNLFTYMNALNDGKGLDLTLYINPPKKLYINVKCLRDYGQFDSEDGQPVMLKKDNIYYLPVNPCEKLIQQGVLEQTDR